MAGTFPVQAFLAVADAAAKVHYPGSAKTYVREVLGIRLACNLAREGDPFPAAGCAVGDELRLRLAGMRVLSEGVALECGVAEKGRLAIEDANRAASRSSPRSRGSREAARAKPPAVEKGRLAAAPVRTALRAETGLLAATRGGVDLRPPAVFGPSAKLSKGGYGEKGPLAVFDAEGAKAPFAVWGRLAALEAAGTKAAMLGLNH